MMIGTQRSDEGEKDKDGRHKAAPTGVHGVGVLGSKPARLKAKGGAPGAGMKASATLMLVFVLGLIPCFGPVRAQEMSKPVTTVDDEVTAFAYALDGRIAYSVRHLYKAKRYDMERDDIFMLEPGGKRKKIFSGEKFSTGDKPITYLIEGFTWSPNSKILAVQMNTIAIDIQDGRTDEPERALLFLDDSGREIRPVTKGVLQERGKSAVAAR